MALQSQGSLLRRESTVAGTTASLVSSAISFDSTLRTICRQAGFADFSTGMRIEVGASLNSGVWTIKTTAATALTVYEPLTAQTSGGDVTLLGHKMQNIGEVASYNGPALTANVIDVTNLQSTAKEKLVGVHDPGQLSMSVFWDNEASRSALHDGIRADLTGRTLRKWDIKFTETSTQPSAAYFEGYVSGFSISGAVDNPLKAEITIAISSGVDWINPV